MLESGAHTHTMHCSPPCSPDARHRDLLESYHAVPHCGANKVSTQHAQHDTTRTSHNHTIISRIHDQQNDKSAQLGHTHNLR